MAEHRERGSVFRDANGRWTAVIELGSRDGKRRRKTIRVKTQAEALLTLRRLREEYNTLGELNREVLTVEMWINEWFRTIALQKIRPKTAASYRHLIDHEIIPALGTIHVGRLTPADVRGMNTGIVAKGLSPTTAAQAYRILAVALKYAEREGHTTRNVARLVDAPRKARPQLRALTVEEGKAVLNAATGTQWESLWYAVLFTGARQGELLGLEIDRVSDSIELSWQLQRLTWEHGCGGECGQARGSECRERVITSPAGWRNRHLVGGLWLTQPKSEAGVRIVPLVRPLSLSIHRHIKECEYPNPYGLVWRMPNGSPIDPRVQSEAWHNLLAEAGVPDVRLHDGRHTAVDLLYEAGIPEDLVMEIVGHSTRSMTRAYKSRGNQKRLASAMLQLAELMDLQKE